MNYKSKKIIDGITIIETHSGHIIKYPEQRNTVVEQPQIKNPINDILKKLEELETKIDKIVTPRG